MMNSGRIWALATDIHVGGGIGEGGGSKGPGVGAAYLVQYAPAYRKIKQLETKEPGLAAVGHFLYSTTDSRACPHLSKASEFVFGMFVEKTKGWGDKRVWRGCKKDAARRLVEVALIAEREPRPIEIERVGEMADVATRKWAQDWRPHYLRMKMTIRTCELNIEEFFLSQP